MKNYYPVIIRKFKDGPVNVSLEAPEEFPEKPQNITFPVGSCEMTTCWFDTRKEAWEYLIEQNKIRNLIRKLRRQQDKLDELVKSRFIEGGGSM